MDNIYTKRERKMKRTIYRPYDEFGAMYDEWTTGKHMEIKKTFVARDIVECIEKKYPDTGDEKIDEMYDYLYDKALTAHQKLVMMMFAEYKIHKSKEEFESTQNMDIPTLCGMGNTKILFYVESMIVFARNALDVMSTIYSDLIFNIRLDSFNKFSKTVIKSEDSLLTNLKQYFTDNNNERLSAFRLLCGSEKGRALRDIIIHQANIRLEYHEYKENSEKESLFLRLKDMEPIDFEWFVSNFIEEVEEIFSITTSCCKKYLENQT